MVLDRHHRKPRSLGGDNGDWNISLVPHKLHMAYHHIIGNGNPLQLASRLNCLPFLQEYYFTAIPSDHNFAKRVRFGSNGVCKKSHIILDSWNLLFGDMTTFQAVATLNATWVDKDFYLQTFKKRK